MILAVSAGNASAQTEMEESTLPSASVGAMAITLLTVSWQAIRAGLLNPVKSLRTE